MKQTDIWVNRSQSDAASNKKTKFNYNIINKQYQFNLTLKYDREIRGPEKIQ